MNMIKCPLHQIKIDVSASSSSTEHRNLRLSTATLLAALELRKLVGASEFLELEGIDSNPANRVRGWQAVSYVGVV